MSDTILTDKTLMLIKEENEKLKEEKENEKLKEENVNEDNYENEDGDDQTMSQNKKKIK